MAVLRSHMTYLHHHQWLPSVGNSCFRTFCVSLFSCFLTVRKTLAVKWSTDSRTDGHVPLTFFGIRIFSRLWQNGYSAELQWNNYFIYGIIARDKTRAFHLPLLCYSRGEPPLSYLRRIFTNISNIRTQS